MRRIDYKTYEDKILGCYLGVSVGGLVGAPYEGAKEIIDVDIDLSVVDNMLFNDDLDLQVLFFQAAEKYGMRFNSNQLAELFFKRCPYSPGEYAIFKKNYERGILPPHSGSFNNSFYSEGMGCCIRGELWGCLFPGDCENAKKYSYFDGAQDHSAESIYSEYFVASMISLGFFTDDINEILEGAKNEIPKGTKFRNMLESVLKWCEEETDINVIRDKILWEYGHPDCTNVFQNLGIIVAGLKLYFDDFEELIKRTIRCGYDTDCTGGIVAAVWGVVHGGEAIEKKYNLNAVKLVVAVDCPDYGGLVSKFSEAVALRGADFHKKGGSPSVEIVGAPETNAEYKDIVLYEVGEYNPILPFNEERTFVIYADVPVGKKGHFVYKNDKLEVRSVEVSSEDGRYRLEITVYLPWAKEVSANLSGTISFTEDDGTCDAENSVPFGFAPPCVLEVSKPYFDTSAHLHFEKGGRYYDYFDAEKDLNKQYDDIRKYHLNYVIPETEDEDFLENISSGEPFENKKVTVFEDKINTEKLTGFIGPCTIYVRRTVKMDKAGMYSLWCGCENDTEVWLNGKKLTENRDSTFFTYEILHVNAVQFKKGKNYLVFKIKRKTGSENFSCNILNECKVMEFPNHVVNFIQINEN